ncbi:helix-turn-helix domain-containing protein [Flammeovirga pacifica]|uniref:Transposase IS30-like HTH domain-containing protein n=1 Tax=Flammeovirga pacifica TaxID=915059 RepID=A0A1S1YU49_FLAPC|nr:helix-turn-helix domain-containing protein [Flammeovirga pacifica]OHX64325.1 hypothetical protein NH26_22280 [Flammeovirga pacifica]
MAHFTLAQREQLAYLLQHGGSKQRIAEVLGVHLSTLYREIKRNSIDGQYNATKAHNLALARKKVVGSLNKTSAFISPKRKNKYELYADRRYIYWHSDSPSVRKSYIFVRWHFGAKYHRYKIRLEFEKIYHYLKDLPLLQTLIEVVAQKSIVSTPSFNVYKSKPHQETKMIQWYTKVVYHNYLRVA